MRYLQYYFPLSVLSLALATLLRGWFLTLIFGWIGLSLMLVVLMHASGRLDQWRRSLDGSYRWPMQLVLLPVIIATYAKSLLRNRFVDIRRVNKVGKHLFVGTGLTPFDLKRFADGRERAVLDVTAEFAGLSCVLRSKANTDYLAIPVAPGSVPREDQLRRILNWIDCHRQQETPVLIHSANGSSNVLMIAIAQLMTLNPRKSIHEFIDELKPHVHCKGLSDRQVGALERFRKDGIIKALNHAWVIANPVAGGGKWHESADFVVQRLESFYRLTVTTTTPELTARDLAMRALADQADVVIACGGDGTLAEVADVVADSDAVLGMIPLGTSNSLCFSLWGIESKLMPVETACDHIVSGSVVSVDIGACNGQTMLLAMGLGFEHAMIASADRDSKNESGQMAYINGLWEAIQRNEASSLEVAFDDEDYQSVETSSLVVANASPVSAVLAQGGGKPSISDGLLDVTWLDPQATAAGTVQTMAELFMAGIVDRPAQDAVHHRRVKRIRIRGPQALDYVLDGEVESAEELDISVHHKALAIMSPQLV